MIQLTLAPLRFYSVGDEIRYFDGLRSIPAVATVVGERDGLRIELDEARLDQGSLLELLALMYRYGNAMEGLAVLAGRPGLERLSDPAAYWYGRVFKP